MSSATILVGLGAFLACAVEMVEALTIVLGVGTVRGWRSTLIGVGAAAVVLAVLVAALGPALQQIPIDDLRLRRRRAAARLRAAVAAQGDPALERLQAAARRGRGVPARAGRGRGGGRRAAGRARLVLVHGRLQGRPARGAGGRLHRDHVRKRAGPARPWRSSARSRRSWSSSSPACWRAARSQRVPENTIKFAVGLLLTSFGCFWGAEGAGADWPGDELSLLALIAFIGALLVAARAGAAAPAAGARAGRRRAHEVRAGLRPLLVGLHRRRRLDGRGGRRARARGCVRS